MNTRPIYWLHLSDLHFGAPGKEVLNQAIAEFFQALHDKIIPIAADLILVSGDVASSGKPEEYDRADGFFADLRSTLTEIYDALRFASPLRPGQSRSDPSQEWGYPHL